MFTLWFTVLILLPQAEATQREPLVMTKTAFVTRDY